MSAKVFVLGRPGSGKSTAARHLIELAGRRNYSYLFIQDYDILYKMFLDDSKHEKFRPTNCGGFDVIDYTVLDTALRQLEKNVQASVEFRHTDIAVIEFARNNYSAALSVFSPAFLQDAYIIFIDSDLESCIQRVHERVTNPPRPDRHFVSEHIMRTYYSNENWEYMACHFKQEYAIRKEVVAMRNSGSLEVLLDEVSDFAEIIFRSESVLSLALDRATTRTLSLHEVDHM
jgi:hypothetical protein